jgi:hypothetical protein
MDAQPLEALTEIAIHPGIHGIRIAGAIQALLGHGMRRLARRDFEQGGGAFTQIGFRMGHHGPVEFRTLIVGQKQYASLWHRITPPHAMLPCPGKYDKFLPNYFINLHNALLYADHAPGSQP